MSAIEDNAMELKLDRSNWELVRFGDVAIQQKKTVDRENTHLKRYVKGEHMASEDLHLREWGSLEDEYLGPAFIRYFEEGDILYGSRRTYLRKVTIAPFEGITANTTFVMKPNEKLIDRRLLPFVMLSEGFSQHSIRNSKGSVNPYVNWKDLANFEFLLPPKDQQVEIAELLWAMDAVVEKELAAHKATKSLYEAVSGRIYSRNVEKYSDVLPFDFSYESWTDGILDDVCSLITDGAHASPKTSKLGFPIGTVENMLGDAIDVEGCRIISENDYASLVKNNCQPQAGDVLFSKDGTIGKTFVFNQPDELVLLSSIAIIRPVPDLLDSWYCSLMLESPVFMTEIEKRKSGTALKRIVLKDIRIFRLRLPPVSEQKKISSYLLAIKNNMKSLRTQSEHSKTLKQSLINQVF